MRTRTLFVAAAVALLAACTSTPTDEPRPPQQVEAPVVTDDFRTTTSRGGDYVLGWRPAALEAVPVNDYFELDVWIASAAAPTERIGDARLVVSAWMPDHGHGMVTKPEATFDAATCTYRVKGMLFHMGGFWQLFFDVVRGGSADRAEFELEL